MNVPNAYPTYYRERVRERMRENDGGLTSAEVTAECMSSAVS